MTTFLGALIPRGYDLARISITLIDQEPPHSAITVTTDDEGGGAYLRVDIDEHGISIEHDGLAAIAEIGRRMCALVDGESEEELKAPAPGMNRPGRAITQTTDTGVE